MKQALHFTPPQNWIFLQGEQLQAFYAETMHDDPPEHLIGIAIPAQRGDNDPIAQLSYYEIGHVDDRDRDLDLKILENRLRDDLLIANREAELTQSETVRFIAYTPVPVYQPKNHELSFGIKMKFGDEPAYNYNLIRLTRMGYVELKVIGNSEQDVHAQDWQNTIDISDAQQAYNAFDPQQDYLSERKLINLIMSSNFI